MGHLPTIFGCAIDTGGGRQHDDMIWLREVGRDRILTVSVLNVWAEPGRRQVSNPPIELGDERRSRKKSAIVSAPQPGRFRFSRNEKSPVIAIEMVFDDSGKLREENIFEAECLVRSTLSHADYDLLMHGDDDHPFRHMLLGLRDLTRDMHKLRAARGYIDEDAFEGSLFRGRSPAWSNKRNGQSRAWQAKDVVKESMLAANTVIGRFCEANDLPCLYRNQRPGSDEVSYAQLILAASIVKNGMSRQAVAEARELLDDMCRPAYYGTENEGHFLLNEPVYTRVTSPIMKAPDRINERCLLAKLRRERQTPFSVPRLRNFAQRINKMAESRRQSQMRRVEVAVRQRHKLPRRVGMRR
jgi:exoribonuclease R